MQESTSLKNRSIDNLPLLKTVESKSALIKIHLSLIYMLVSVVVNSVNKIISFTTAYLPRKTFTNKVSL